MAPVRSSGTSSVAHPNSPWPLHAFSGGTASADGATTASATSARAAARLTRNGVPRYSTHGRRAFGRLDLEIRDVRRVSPVSIGARGVLGADGSVMAAQT